MKKRVTSLAVASLLGLGGIAGGAVLAPAVASAATSGTGVVEAAGDRVAQIREALAGLVTDGTITQEQADEYLADLESAFEFRVTWDGEEATPSYTGLGS